MTDNELKNAFDWINDHGGDVPALVYNTLITLLLKEHDQRRAVEKAWKDFNETAKEAKESIARFWIKIFGGKNN